MSSWHTILSSPDKSIAGSTAHTQRGWTVTSITMLILLLAIVGAAIFIYKNYLYSGGAVSAQAFPYSDILPVREDCLKLPGRSADHLQQRSTNHIKFSVTTPSNYRQDYPHALLVVWAPSGFSPFLSERFTGLTGAATARGYIVAHVASVPLGLRALEEMATIPAQITDIWCIDESRVYYTGHSDGGTVSNALAVLEVELPGPTAIAPSAMGMRGEDMSTYACPAPIPVMLMHNEGDGHFPGFGEEVAEWWARCNRCGPPVASAEHAACIEYVDCAASAKTLFCQAKGNHAYWPGLEHDVLGFFDKLGEARP